MTPPILPSLPPAPHRVPHWFALSYLGALVVVSLYPFTEWEFNGQPWLDFLLYPLPYYRTAFDQGVNVLAYVPYGVALARMFRPAWLGVLAALGLGALTSLVIEITQLYLPMRVASNLDVLCNAAGALAGGLLATLPWTVRLGRAMQRLRRHWLLADNSADYALMLVALWFLTQINPANPLFGVVVMPEGLPQPFESPIANPALFLFLLEAGGAMLNLTATLLFIASFLARRRDYAPVLGGFFLLAWWFKVAVAAAMLKPVAYFAWINPHVLAGLALGGVLTWLLCHTQRLVQSLCALLLLGLAQLAAAQWPLVAADDDQRGLFRWAYHLTNINALSEFANHLWPWAAMGCLLISALRQFKREQW